MRKYKNWVRKISSWKHLSEDCPASFSLSTAAAKSLQSCPTLCDPIDSSPPDSPVPGILQARTLEWVAISFSNACKWKVKVKSLSHVWPFSTPWTAAYQAPPSMGFSRQEYWSGVPLPSPMSIISTGNRSHYTRTFFKFLYQWIKSENLAPIFSTYYRIGTFFLFYTH